MGPSCAENLTNLGTSEQNLSITHAGLTSALIILETTMEQDTYNAHVRTRGIRSSYVVLSGMLHAQ